MSEEIARQLYPQEEDSYYFSFYDYEPIMKHCGEVVLEQSDNDYSGDTYALLKKGDKYGYLQFGWGSCSYCDALQSCSNYKELGDLIARTEQDVKWFDSPADGIRYFREHDWEGDYHYGPDFNQKAIAYLESLAAAN